MKKLLIALLSIVAAPAFGQSLPSPRYQDVTINGSLIFKPCTGYLYAGADGSTTCVTANGLAPDTPSLSGANSWLSPQTFGSNGAVTGEARFANGAGTGASVVVRNNAAEAAYYFNLPSTAGTDGYVLTSGGGGTEPMRWSPLAAVANSASASDLTTGTLAAARGGAGNINGALKGNGSGVVSQAAFADLSNALTALPCDTAAVRGFSGDGTTDNTAAFNAWFTSLGGASGCLKFGPGSFKFNSAISKTLGATQSLVLTGEGAATELFSSGAHDFLTVTYAARTAGPTNPGSGVLRMSDLRLTTDQVGGVEAVHINGANVGGAQVQYTRFDNLTIEGHDSTSYFAYGIRLIDTGHVLVNDLMVNAVCLNSSCTDTGVSFESTGATPVPTDLKVVHMQMMRGGRGVYATGDFEGVNVLNSVFSGLNIAFECNGSVAGKGWCSIVNSHANSITHDVKITNVYNNIINGNVFYGGAYGTGPANPPTIYLDTSNNNQIIGNVFKSFSSGAANPIGIKFFNTNANASITGNTFADMYSAIELSAGTSRVTGSANVFSGTTPNSVVDAGTNNFVEFQQTQFRTFWSADDIQMRLSKGASGKTARITGQTNGCSRWDVVLGGTGAESGSNAGSDFLINRYSDTCDAFIDSPLTINRATGGVIMGVSAAAPLFRDTSAAPTLSSCGTSPTIQPNSANSAGKFTTGTGTPTACTVTFSNSGWTTAAWCSVTPANAAAAAISGGYYVSAQSATAFTLTLGTGTDSAAFQYVCGGD